MLLLPEYFFRGTVPVLSLTVLKQHSFVPPFATCCHSLCFSLLSLSFLSGDHIGALCAATAEAHDGRVGGRPARCFEAPVPAARRRRGQPRHVQEGQVEFMYVCMCAGEWNVLEVCALTPVFSIWLKPYFALRSFFFCRTPSFYTSKSLVNLSGLSISDPAPIQQVQYAQLFIFHCLW